MNQYFENNENLKSEINKIDVKVKEISFSFYTDNGVFNKNGLDYGTRLLLENIDLNNKSSFLDVGCGCGPIGIYISKLTNKTVDMVDVNNRAIHLSEKSIKENNLNKVKVFLSDAYNNISDNYDCIVTNPPIHAGKKKVYEIFTEGINHLNKDGEVWTVIRKDQGAKSLIKDMEKIYSYEIVCKSKGFYIIKFKPIDKK